MLLKLVADRKTGKLRGYEAQTILNGAGNIKFMDGGIIDAWPYEVVFGAKPAGDHL